MADRRPARYAPTATGANRWRLCSWCDDYARSQHGDACNKHRQEVERAFYPRRYAGQRILPPRRVADFLANVGDPDPETGCMEWSGGRFQRRGNQESYGAFSDRSMTIAAHRLAYALAHGEVPAGAWVLHRCDNPPCCNPLHLYIGDNERNVQDRTERDRSPRGSDHHAAVLTDEQVTDLRRRYAAGERSDALAREVGLSLGATQAMLQGRSWVHLPGAVMDAKALHQVRGESAGLARLTEAQVREARADYAADRATTAGLAARYGISKSSMRQALAGVTWTHLPGAVKKGSTGPRGERGGNAVLDAEKVRAIRRRAAAGETQQALADEYGVAHGQVSKIVRRERWAHVD